METLNRNVDQVRAEIAEVRRELFAALADLASPLGELVRSQLERSFSQSRAGLLLVAGMGRVDSTQARQQRILLSAALEMLYLALSIHKLLLAYTQSDDKQASERAWTGSVILTGDYCFSRSAILAAQTDLPQVVDIFAHVLKIVSEGLLRDLFHTNKSLETLYDEEYVLVGAGLHAATVIANLDQESAQTTIHFGQKLLTQLASTPPVHLSAIESPLPIAPFQKKYWQALLTLVFGE